MRGKFVNTSLYINCGFSSIRRRFGNASKISSAPGFCKQLSQCLDLRVPLPHTQCPHFFCHIAFLLSRLRFHPADERQTPLEQHLKSVAGDDFWLRASILQHILLVIKFLTSAPCFYIFVFVVFSPPIATMSFQFCSRMHSLYLHPVQLLCHDNLNRIQLHFEFCRCVLAAQFSAFCTVVLSHLLNTGHPSSVRDN